MTLPPCWPDGHPCPNPCAAALYERDVYGKQYLTAEWQGWRLAGRVLVSPDGDRISPERLRGILFHESMRSRRVSRTAPARVNWLPAREQFRGSA